MKILLKQFAMLVALLLIVACSGEKVEKEDDAKDNGAAEMSAKIRAMEDSLFENLAFNKRNAQMLLDVYKAYAAAYPLDNGAPEYLFRAAGVARSMKDPQQSIALYDRIIRDYSNWERLPDTYYLKAFTIDTELKHKGNAKEAYQQVIYQFPDHPFAADAKAMIANLEYTDEELIARWKQQADQDSTATSNR